MSSHRSVLPRPLAAFGTIAAVVLVGAIAAAVVVAGTTPQASAHDEPTTQTVQPDPNLDALADSETPAIGGISAAGDDEPLAGATAETRDAAPNECPVLTDSIRRLYLGFLEREPSRGELERDIDRYRRGDANLEALATTLANSGLFRTAYGPLSDGAYVERVYANTIAREPSDDDASFWVTTLDDGYARGSVMLAFTESAEFVRRTATARPLSGYLAWYPAGVHWYCGIGPRSDVPIQKLVGDFWSVDHFFTNHGLTTSAIGVTTLSEGRRVIDVLDATLPPGFSDFRWDAQFAGADDYGDAMDVRADDQTSWVVVFYPGRVGRQRLGWHAPW